MRLQATVAALILLGGAARADRPSADDIMQRVAESRASEAANWGMPAVNYDVMLQKMLTKTAGKVNEVIYWGRPLDWHNQTLTPNPDILYLMSFLNTKDVGPISCPRQRRRGHFGAQPAL